jgi:hypothetical protein
MHDEVTFTILETAHGYEVYTKHAKYADKWRFKNVNKVQVVDLMLAITQTFNNKFGMGVLFEMG